MRAVDSPGPLTAVAIARHADTVVCSPHFDDAVLCCWSVLDRDQDCAVLNVFTGAPDAGFTSWVDHLNGASTSAAYMCQRALEDRNALSVAGKLPIDLGMLEVQYRLRQSPALHALLRRMRLLRFVLLRLPVLRTALYAVSAPSPEKLADAIMQAAPGAANVCAPAGIGGHADHLLVRQAAAVLASRGLNVRLYADMPYAVRYGWPRWIAAPDAPREQDRASAFWVRHLNALHLDDPMEMATVVHLTPEERARKASAIRQYASQIGALSAGRMRGWLQDAALSYEVYWQLLPATATQPRHAFVGGPRLAGSTGAMTRGASELNGRRGTAQPAGPNSCAR